MKNASKGLAKKRALQAFVPSFVTSWIFPEFEGLVRDDFNVRQLVPFLAPEQESGGRIWAIRKLEILQENGLISRTLSLDEGRTIIDQGIPSAFRGRHLLLWRSAARDSNGHQFVPLIQNISGQPSYVKPMIYWYWLGYDLFSHHCAPLFETN